MIFISYAREDTERASRIYSLLSRNDRPIFYDKESILPGMDWRLEIEEKLNACSLILFLCTANSIAKEGFVQKEIRLALDRAECMPDGRIFIIPIRFDKVTIPKKLAKYHWLEVNTDADFFNIQFFINIIWKRINNIEVQEQSQQGITIDRDLLRENVVIFMTGKNVNGNNTYAYIQIALWKLQELKAATDAGEKFLLSDYGVVLASGRGEPSDDIRKQMASKYNLIDIPKPLSKEEEEEREIYEKFAFGFTEAFKVIAGGNIDMPLIKPPDVIPPNSTALREGLKEGLKAAQSIVSTRNS